MSTHQKLLTLSSGGWVLILAAFFTVVAALLVLYPSFVNGFHPPIGDGKHLDSYGFNLANLTLPREKLTPSGNAKDQIDAIPPRLVETITPPEVALIAQNEHIRFLVPSDRIIGLIIAGQSRAYPLRVLVLHELVNDVLGGTPIAISYSPLCDSALVFDRRIDGPTASPSEFGVSGLLLNSNPIFFDRRKDPAQESLWPQLTLHAISGPLVNKPLPLIPYQLVTWADWVKDHPDTRVLLGLRRRKTEYGSEPYSVYLHHDDPMFPVDPLWNNPNLPRKTPIIVTSTDNGKSWTATLPTQHSLPATQDSALSTQHFQIHTFLFAWYAQHPTDTSYSTLTK